MALSLLIGIIGSALGAGKTVPQFLRIIRQRHAVGVSTTSLAFGLVSGIGWSIYGVLANLPSVALTGAAAAVQFGATLWAAKRFSAGRIGVKPLLWSAVLALTLAAAGASWLGVILAASALLTGLPQLRLARSGAALSGVSELTWLSSVVEGMLWLGVGITSRDAAVTIWALGQLVVSVPISWRLSAIRRAKARELSREENHFPVGL